jgi:hypothetical protein
MWGNSGNPIIIFHRKIHVFIIFKIALKFSLKKSIYGNWFRIHRGNFLLDFPWKLLIKNAIFLESPESGLLQNKCFINLWFLKVFLPYFSFDSWKIHKLFGTHAAFTDFLIVLDIYTFFMLRKFLKTCLSFLKWIFRVESLLIAIFEDCSRSFNKFFCEGKSSLILIQENFKRTWKTQFSHYNW